MGTLPVRCALRLAPLVFVCPGELRKAEWAGIDLEGAEWRYAVTKTDTPHVVPLARHAVEILRELHPLTGHGRYAFPNVRCPHRERPMSHAALWGAFRASDIRPDRMTIHGVRAMARTILYERIGIGYSVIGSQGPPPAASLSIRSWTRGYAALEVIQAFASMTPIQTTRVTSPSSMGSRGSGGFHGWSPSSLTTSAILRVISPEVT